MPTATAVRPDVLTDEELVARVRAGDHEVFGLLWRRHASVALGVARQYRGCDPEDVVQDAVHAVYLSIVRGGGPQGSFRPYLLRAVRNRAASTARRTKAAPVGDLHDMAEHTLEDATPDCSDGSLDRMLTVPLLRELPDRWRMVLWYTCIEDLSPAQAGKLMGMSPNAVSALAKRARDGLRRSWRIAYPADENAA